MDNGKKIGFIGFGNMAQAIAKGLLEAKVCKAEQLYACAAHFENSRTPPTGWAYTRCRLRRRWCRTATW